MTSRKMPGALSSRVTHKQIVVDGGERRVVDGRRVQAMLEFESSSGEHLADLIEFFTALFVELDRHAAHAAVGEDLPATGNNFGFDPVDVNLEVIRKGRLELRDKIVQSLAHHGQAVRRLKAFAPEITGGAEVRQCTADLLRPHMQLGELTAIVESHAIRRQPVADAV